MNLSRIERKVLVRADVSPDNGEIVMYLPEEALGPVVTGKTFEEAKAEMDAALEVYSAMTSLINAINAFNDKVEPQPIHFVSGWAA